MSSLIAVKVHRKTAPAQQVCSLELHPVDGPALPAFTAGAHIDLHLPGGLVRQYSLCNDSRERHRYEIAVLCDAQSRGGSLAVHQQVNEGDVVHISAPKNLFALQPAPHYVLVAGGIGITPIWAMAQELMQQGQSFEVHYAGRSAASMAFVQALHGLSEQVPVQLYHDDAGQRFQPERTLADTVAGAHLYVCGPQGFIEHVLSGAQQQGWSAARLHREYFALEQAAVADGDAFELLLAQSNLQVTVPRGQTVVEVLAAHDIHIPTVCEAGICGSCVTPVLDGVPDHHDEYLSETEKTSNKLFTPCCSRSCSPVLVIDL